MPSYHLLNLAYALSRHSLGDRHGENILFDSTTGDTVHVDFNCLFEKVRGVVRAAVLELM
jgi:hypothetical protein